MNIRTGETLCQSRPSTMSNGYRISCLSPNLV